jgi:dihydroorotate dehydrogenase
LLTEKLYGLALTNPGFFRRVVRPLIYQRCGGDAERVHEFAVKMLEQNQNALEDVSAKFDFPDLHLQVAGNRRMPFGTAAGFDKDGEVLYPLSLIFGFEEPGTLVLHRREGNKKPRIAADAGERELYNAQGFPSLGAEHFATNAKRYRERGGKAPLLASICGIPPSPDKMDVAYAEMESIVDLVGSYVDGFVWNPFSPNTAALGLLRTPECFRQTAELLRRKAGQKLKLVKMGPYDDIEEKRSDWKELMKSWMEGGGDGVVATNAYMVPRSQVPSSRWGYDWAGRSGRFLHSYRDRAVMEARKEFPSAVVIATGGIDSGEEAWRAFAAGADLLEGYTPYTFESFGLLIKMSRELGALLKSKGYSSLEEFVKRH